MQRRRFLETVASGLVWGCGAPHPETPPPDGGAVDVTSSVSLSPCPCPGHVPILRPVERRPLVVIFGQSVVQGQIGGAGNVAGPLKSHLPVPHPTFLAYRDTYITSREIQPWHNLRFRQPTAGWNWAAAETVYAPMIGTGALIEVSQGATTTYVDWNPTTPGPLYTRLVTTVPAALAAYPDQSVRWNPCIYVNLGQSDAKTWAHTNAYHQNMGGILAGLRACHPALADAPVIMDKLHPQLGIAGAIPETIAVINAAIEDLADIALETGHLTQHVDKTHWVESAYVTHGPEVYEAIRTVLGIP